MSTFFDDVKSNDSFTNEDKIFEDNLVSIHRGMGLEETVLISNLKK